MNAHDTAARLAARRSGESSHHRIAAARHGARRLSAPARRAATDRRVRAEARRATRHVSRATRRAQRVGLANAATDRYVTRNLRRASRHALRAADMAINPPRHRVRNGILAALGGGTMIAAALGARRRAT